MSDPRLPAAAPSPDDPGLLRRTVLAASLRRMAQPPHRRFLLLCLVFYVLPLLSQLSRWPGELERTALMALVSVGGILMAHRFGLAGLVVAGTINVLGSAGLGAILLRSFDAALFVVFWFVVVQTLLLLSVGVRAERDMLHRDEIARQNQRLAELAQLYGMVTDYATDLVALLARDGRFVYASPSYGSVLGYDPAQLAGLSLLDLCHPDDRSMVRAALAAEPAPHGMTVTYRARTQPGADRWLEMVIRADPGRVDTERLWSAIARDITERKAFEEQLSHQALHDALTGLPNRVLLVDRLEHALRRARRRGCRVALLFLDLDGFKLINDALGHEVGDRLLLAVTVRLRDCLRSGDTVARFGGDEFAVLLEDIAADRDAVEIADRIHAQLAPPFMVDGQQMSVTASIGIACDGGERGEASDLVRNADIAMYHAKHEGKARSRFFDLAMQQAAVAQLQLDTDLREAVQRGEFVLHYQPLMRLDTGKVLGFEALVRWQHPERGLVYPKEFIPIAEESGLIVLLGEWVLAEACRQARIWQTRYPSQPPLLMSINLSTKQFQFPGLVSVVQRVIGETGVDPHGLQFEITETTLMRDEAQTLATMHALREMGIRLALDDFGTGHASMAYLKQFPVDVLKIDQSFINQLESDPEDAAIVRSVIALGQVLNLAVTGEGIERPDQLERLHQMGCQIGQGFFFAKALHSEAAEAFLASRPA